MRPLVLPLAERLGRLALVRGAGFTSRHVHTEHGKLHTYEARGTGDLPTTVVLHGLGSAATPFGPLLSRLRPHTRRVIAPDYPGHGFSADVTGRLTPERLFDAVTSALDSLAPEPSAERVADHDGGLALRYAIEHPERVSALVLVSPAGAHSSDEEWQAIRRLFAITSRKDAITFLERVYHRPPWFIPFVARELPITLTRPAVRDLLESASNDHAPTPEALAALSMPVLFLWGRSEKLLPDTHFEWFSRHLPAHAVIERPYGMGHCPHFDAPGALVRRIVAFAREATAG